MSVILVDDLRYQELDRGRFRLEGKYRINAQAAKPILDYVYGASPDVQSATCVRELVFALSGLSDGELDQAVDQDATYGNPNVGIDNVIDFGEWVSSNYSAAAAHYAAGLLGTRVAASASEKVHLYIRHLRRRLKGEQ